MQQRKNSTSLQYSNTKASSSINPNTTAGSSKHQMPPLFESPRNSLKEISKLGSKKIKPIVPSEVDFLLDEVEGAEFKPIHHSAYAIKQNTTQTSRKIGQNLSTKMSSTNMSPY